MRLLLAVAAAALATLPVAAQTGDSTLPEPVAAAGRSPHEVRDLVEPLIRRQLETRRIAGAVVAIVTDGAVALDEGFGHADVAAGRTMRADTPVRIASVTKTFTALAVMQLADRGAIDLDSDVNEYLDFSVPAGVRPVTLRRLLSHQSGFENRTGDVGAWTGGRVPLGHYLAGRAPARIAAHENLVAYSNFNYALAAYVVERASGQPFEDYLEDHIFEPLQMTRTTARQPPPGALARDVSNGYVRSDLPPTPVSAAAFTVYEVGSAGITTTASDMARFLEALVSPDPRIVSRAALDAMMTPQTPTPRGVAGLGLFSPAGGDAGRNPFFGHDGATGGFRSTLAMLPRAGFGLFVSYNSEGLIERVSASDELLAAVAARLFAGEQAAALTAPEEAIPGVYERTAGASSTFFRLQELAGQIAVRNGEGEPTIAPAFLPFGEPLEHVEPGLFRWRGRDVSFARIDGKAVMQIGSPIVLLSTVPWWTAAGLVVPIVAVCLIAAAAAVAGWAFGRKRRQMTAGLATRRLRSATRLALLLYLVAVVAACWLVFLGWPLAAASSPVALPLVLGIYVTAWTAIALTPLAAWNAVRTVREPGSAWRRGCDVVFALAAVFLAVFCVYWRIAGTTLAL